MVLNAAPFVPTTKTFRINNSRDRDIIEEISRIANEREVSDSKLIRHALRVYVRSYHKRKAES